MQSRQHSTARHCIADSRALPCCPQPEQGFSHRQPEQGFSQALRLEAARLQPGRFLESQRGNAKQTDTQTDTDMPCTDTSTDRDMHCRQTQPCIAPLPSSCRQPCSARQQTWGRRSWQNRLADTHTETADTDTAKIVSPGQPAPFLQNPRLSSHRRREKSWQTRAGLPAPLHYTYIHTYIHTLHTYIHT